MLIHQSAPELIERDTLILATDIDSKILEKAEAGTYAEQQITGIPDDMRAKYLSATSDGYAVTPSLRRLIRFRELNLLRDWPMRNRFDVIFCRNVVIYFDAATQDTLWPRFENALEPTGWFFLGHSERVSDAHAPRFHSIGMTAYRLNRGAQVQNATLKEA
jgi:chemotaxis protein methyltransferase CheR